MECPYCQESLQLWDKFTTQKSRQRGESAGDIFICPNENVCQSEVFNYTFHIYRSDSKRLLEGMPC